MASVIAAMIEWDPVEVLTCLEAEPTVDGEGASYRYVVSRDGIVLALEIWRYEGDVWLAIRRADRHEPLIDLRSSVCRAIRYVREADREELYFAGSDGGWRLQVRPHITVMIGHQPPI